MVFPSRHLCLIALLGTAFIPARGEVIDLTSETQTPDTFDPAKIITASNKLIVLGKDDAAASLLHYAKTPPHANSPMALENRDYTMAWLCLLIYDPMPKSGLPWPMFGGPNFPPETGTSYGLPTGPMNNTTWPRFPLVLSHGVPFLLAPSYYALGGLAEPGFFFLKRCQARGIFHSTFYQIPTHADAQVALTSLISSPEWKALNWHESTSPTYLHANENREIEFLRQQVERIR
jgi:hypothetical protein